MSTAFIRQARASAPSRQHRYRRRLGFTLLEMLLALTVIAIVGITVSNSVGNVAGQSFSLERRTVAHWVGQNHMARLRLAQRSNTTPGPSAVPTGRDSIRLSMGGREWEVRSEVTATTVPRMFRVEIDVYELVDDDVRGPIDHVVAFLGQS